MGEPDLGLIDMVKVIRTINGPVDRYFLILSAWRRSISFFGKFKTRQNSMVVDVVVRNSIKMCQFCQTNVGNDCSISLARSSYTRERRTGANISPRCIQDRFDGSMICPNPDP